MDPPGISNTSADAVRVADMVLIPAKASAFDVWATTDIVAAVKARQQSSNGIPRAAFVITMAKPRTRLGRQIDAALAELGLPVLNSRTSDRRPTPMPATKEPRCWKDPTGPHAMRSSPYTANWSS